MCFELVLKQIQAVSFTNCCWLTAPHCKCLDSQLTLNQWIKSTAAQTTFKVSTLHQLNLGISQMPHDAIK